MDFKTKEDYEKHINNMYIDHWKEAEFSSYKKPDKHYIYPKYEVFDKELSTNHTDAQKFIHDTLYGFTLDAIVAQAMGDPVEDLTSNQKLGIYIGAGIPIKYEEGKFITMYDVGISLIDGKYKVFYKIPPFNNTYC
jgi:hypothetical protein